jgi:hypothetical protein
VNPGRLHEQRVERWLRGLGLVPERFDARLRRLSKTPDFRVRDGADGRFLLEVKSLARPVPGHDALALKLVRAKAQFDAVNDGGRLANVVALVAPEPGLLVPVLAELSAPSPLAGLDLVLGLADHDEVAVRVLHLASPGRHAAYLRRTLPLGELA